MCNFGSYKQCRSGRREVSSYIDVGFTNYQYRILDPTLLETTTGYIMEDSVDAKYMKKLSQQNIIIIYGSVSSYFSVVISLGHIDMIKKPIFSGVLSYIDSDCLGDI